MGVQVTRTALLILVAGLALEAAKVYNCEFFKTSSCNCVEFGRGLNLFCPSNIRIYIYNNTVDYNSADCIFTTEIDLDIEYIETFGLYIEVCPLPLISFKNLLNRLGIKRVSKIVIDTSNYRLNNTLQKIHFDQLDEVRSIDLNNAGLTYLPVDVFEGLKNLRSLSMINNAIDLNVDIFRNTPQIEELYLRKNNISVLKNSFTRLKSLRILDLSNNNVLNLTKGLWSNSLENLDLHCNKIKNIEFEFFRNFTKLKTLDLSYNPLQSLHEECLADLPALREVKLNSCNISRIPESTFKNTKNIRQLRMSHNELREIKENVFESLQNLEELDVSYNKISNIKEKIFYSTRKIKFLNLCYNQLNELHPSSFSQLTELEFLDLRSNMISKVDQRHFENLQALKVLNISDNLLTTLTASRQEHSVLPYFIPFSMLMKCTKLEELQLSNNSLQEMGHDWNFNLPIHTLNLSFNHLQHLKTHDLFLNNVLRTIDVSNNNISIVEPPESRTFPQKGAIDRYINLNLTNNPLRCDCFTFPFVKIYISDRMTIDIWEKITLIINNELYCYEPAALRNKSFREAGKYILCDTEQSSNECPDRCKCQYRPWDGTNLVNCSHSGLQVVPTSLPLYQDRNHTELIMAGNRLVDVLVPSTGGYDNVTLLDLSHNQIKRFKANEDSLGSIKVLDLSNNSIQGLAGPTVTLLSDHLTLERLVLGGNPWQCDCELQPLIILDKRLRKPDEGNKVFCSNGTSWDELLVSEMCLGTENISPIYGLLAVPFALAVFVMISTPLYYKNKKRVQIYLYSSQWKILRWMVTQPDIDEDKVYDAFVSFAYQDEDFVLNHLVRRLEEGETKFKLCLHFRDWIPGEMIPLQILESVKTSRRTIIVLSPNFLQSVWGKMEFKTAHTVALTEGMTRIIVVLYEDVGPLHDLDDELRTYLQMHTYVKWGSPWFWQQLLYAMPHPRQDSDTLRWAVCCGSGERVNGDEVVQYVAVSIEEV